MLKYASKNVDVRKMQITLPEVSDIGYEIRYVIIFILKIGGATFLPDNGTKSQQCLQILTRSQQMLILCLCYYT